MTKKKYDSNLAKKSILKMPLLTIITINLNNKSGLQKTIESVINQSFKEFEFVLIDGESTDGSLEIIESYRSYFQVCVSESDRGVYHAMNKGIAYASGEYLLFLNSGDWLFNDKVIADVESLFKDYDVISGDINIYDKEKWSIFVSEDKITVDYFLRISLFHQATFIKKELFLQNGMYDESFSLGGDYEFFIRTLLKNNNSYKHIPIVISNFVANGMSNKKEFEAINLKERQMAWEKNFSKLVYKHFVESKRIVQSKELKWGNRFFRFFPFAKIIDKLIAKVWY